MTDAYIRTVGAMSTVVTIHVVGHGTDEGQRTEREARVERALAWFARVEQSCSRFDPESEIRRLSGTEGVAVPVSALVYEALRFALAVAEETNGAFDPTVGRALETSGFDREHRSGRAVRTAIDSPASASYRDVHLDDDQRTVTLARPLVLDLGAVAKGLAIDVAARELRPFENFVIDAGGDLYCAGLNADAQPWSVGVRHPRDATAIIETLRVSNVAVCTSGDYERPSSGGDAQLVHHILDPRTNTSATSVASVTVLAPSAMVADALATAAFVLGASAGVELLERNGVDGVVVTPALERFATKSMRADYALPFASDEARR